MQRLAFKTKFILLALCVFILAALFSSAMVLELRKLIDNEIKRAEHAQSFDTGVKKLLQANVEFKIQVQEWKNILLRGTNPVDFDKYTAQFDQQAMQVEQLLKAAQNLLLHTQEAALEISQLQQEHANLTEQYRSALRTFDMSDPLTGKAIDAQIREIDRPFTMALEQKARDVAIRSIMQIKRDSDETLHEMEDAQQTHLIRAMLGVSMLVILLWFFYQSIMRQLGGDPHHTNQIVQRVATGDLTVQINNPSNNSILAQVQQMRNWLEQSVVDLRATSGHLSFIAQQLQDISANLSQSTEQQTKSIAQTSTVLEEIAATAEQNANHSLNLERKSVFTPETNHLIQEIIYASKEQAQSVKLTTRYLSSITSATNKNKSVAAQLYKLAANVDQEASNIHAVLETFKIYPEGKQR